MANCRWIKQRNFYSCGPVALMNLSKWCGNKVAYTRDYHYWLKKCKCNEDGSMPDAFIKSLYSIPNIKITPRSIPTTRIIDNALKDGKAVVMKSASPAMWGYHRIVGHYYLVTDRTENAFYCVNYDANEHLPSAPFQAMHGWISKEFFRKNLLRYYNNFCLDCGVAPYAWIVRKT